MPENNFKTNITKDNKKQFSSRFATLLGISIFLTGFLSIMGVYYIFHGIIVQEWTLSGFQDFAWRTLLFSSSIISFIGLVEIAVNEKPFSKILTFCVKLIGGLFTASAFLIPRLPGYSSSGFEIFSCGSFVLIDGAILIPGLLLIILGGLISEGFHMQKEIDEII